MKNLKYSLLAIVLCLSVIFSYSSCKKEKATAEAIATFIMGDVKLLRQNEAPRQIKHGDRITVQDIIKTGKNSIFAFQVGESAVIRIAANTSVLIADLLAGKSNKLVLNQGRVLASVKKLIKNSVYEVQTPTLVAAIRGTEFSVNCDKDKSVVAVKEGAVNVQRVDEKSAVVEEKIIKKGSAVEVTKKASEVRQINKEEKEEFAKVEKITIIKDINEKSESDLREIEQNVIHGKSAAKKPKSGNENTLEDTSTTNSEASKTNGDTLMWTSKKVYKTEDKVIVSFKNMPDSKYCWISVAKSGTVGGDYVKYNWTYGKTEGEIVFEDLGLEPGDYEARAHFSRKKDINKSIKFKVK